jgi:hypothetical protein
MRFGEHFGGVLIMAHIQPLRAEWLPISTVPSDAELEVCVTDYDGIVHALEFSCRKSGTGWIDTSTKKRIDIHPTHWRKWSESH